MTEDTILGMTSEEFKETMLTSIILSGVSFITVFVTMAVKHYVKESIV